jgi:serine/threonine protein kinase
LSDWLKQAGPLDARAILTILAGICYGLIHAAQIHPGLIHRDLKPGNIMLAQDSEDGGRGRWVGTPPYMPPEQWRGQEKYARSDIYVLGCILYECLTGRRLFAVKSHKAWYRAHANQERPSLPEEMPAALNEIVQTCLRMDADERYTDIHALLQAIDEGYTDEFGQSLPSPPAVAALTASGLINRGNSYAYLERFPAALADYNQVIQIEPDLAQAYENRGEVQWLLANP